MKISAVIFDWAGTTVDFGCCGPVGAVRAAFHQFGIEVTEADARRPMGLLKRDHIAAMMSYTGVSSSWHRMRGSEPGEREIDLVYDAFVALQEDSLREHTTLIPGVLETITELRSQDILIGSTTGYTRPMLRPVAEAAAQQGYVPDSSVTPDEVGRGRPYPFMILQNMVKLNVWPLKSVIKVGDTPVDIAEGLSAGVWSVGVAGTGNGIGMPHQEFLSLPEADLQKKLQYARRELEEAGAHFVINSMTELIGVIQQLEADQ